MKIRTSELIGPALDWAVAKCEGGVSEDIDDFCLSEAGEFDYSTNWAQGGPIIEREGIGTKVDCKRVNGQFVGWWFAELNSFYSDGPTMLVAAMRCYLASKLGGEIEIPEELR